MEAVFINNWWIYTFVSTTEENQEILMDDRTPYKAVLSVCSSLLTKSDLPLNIIAILSNFAEPRTTARETLISWKFYLLKVWFCICWETTNAFVCHVYLNFMWALSNLREKWKYSYFSCFSFVNPNDQTAVGIYERTNHELLVITGHA